jgi:hypothetical protein
MARVARRQKELTNPVLRDDRGPRDRHPRQKRSDHSTFFLAGATIPESGIYEVIHDKSHRDTHESVMVRGDAFPMCDVCQERIRFRVVRTAPYIFEDEDFVE